MPSWQGGASSLPLSSCVPDSCGPQLVAAIQDLRDAYVTGASLTLLLLAALLTRSLWTRKG